MGYCNAESVEEEIYNLEKEILQLKQKLNRAQEALKFYADSDCYSDFGRFGLSEVDEDCGEFARKVLEEIEDERC